MIYSNNPNQNNNFGLFSILTLPLRNKMSDSMRNSFAYADRVLNKSFSGIPAFNRFSGMVQNTVQRADQNNGGSLSRFFNGVFGQRQ